MKKAVFFDINETILNLNELSESFNPYFNNKYVVKYWFTRLLHASSIMGIMDDYKNFGELAAVELENLFAESDKQLTPKIKTEILGSFVKLPAYDDVSDSLKFLKQKGIRVIAVSNSSLQMIKEQLTNAGIIGLFDAYYSVDAVCKYKPYKDIYQYVATEEKIDTQDIVMVATHDWDLFGAKKAGLSTAYIKRSKKIYHPYYAQPNIVKSNLMELAQEIIKM